MTSTLKQLKAYEFPFDVIIEILTWLPVKSLLRFKCVCNQWCSLIKEHLNFISKQMDRAIPLPITRRYDRFGHRTFTVDYCYGLFLERDYYFNYLIRNPATRQVLSLPSSYTYGRSLRDTYPESLFYDPVTGHCKVLALNECGRFQMLTIGEDNRWRAMFNGQRPWCVHFCGAPQLTHYTSYTEITTDRGQDLEIYSIDTMCECVTTNIVSRGAFTDSRQVRVVYWNEALGDIANEAFNILVLENDIANEAFNILVLEDLKEHNWSKNKIVLPLKFLKEDPVFKNQIVKALSFESQTLVMEEDGSTRGIFYDTKWEIITEVIEDGAWSRYSISQA